jgi:hypothetical protein
MLRCGFCSVTSTFTYGTQYDKLLLRNFYPSGILYEELCTCTILYYSLTRYIIILPFRIESCNCPRGLIRRLLLRHPEGSFPSNAEEEGADSESTELCYIIMGQFSILVISPIIIQVLRSQQTRYHGFGVSYRYETNTYKHLIVFKLQFSVKGKEEGVSRATWT